jgi:hypothetical protein
LSGWAKDPSADLQRDQRLELAYGTHSYERGSIIPSFAVWKDGLVMSCWGLADAKPRISQCRHGLVDKDRREELLRSVKACGMLNRPEVDESGGSTRIDGQIVQVASSEPRVAELISASGRETTRAVHRSNAGTEEERCMWEVFSEAAGAASDCSIFSSEKLGCCEDAEAVGRTGQSCR